MFKLKYFVFVLFLGCFTTTQAQQLLDSLTLDTLTATTSLIEAMKNPNAVIKLELKKQKLKSFPIEILKMKNLQYLDISKNNIQEIPDSIELLVNLQHFNASKNKIERMPKQIGKLTNLYYLNMNNNELVSLPMHIGQLVNLRVLDLWSNELSEFPDEMANMKNLITLDLRAILIDEALQKRLRELLPKTNVQMSPSCNCKLN